MSKTLTFTKQAEKGFRKLPAKQREAMAQALTRISGGETAGLDIKKLKGRDGYRLRIGQFRALYTEDLEVVDVHKVGPRGDVY